IAGDGSRRYLKLSTLTNFIMKNKFPIRYKFLLVTTALLVFSVASYLFLASDIFRRDKVELVFDLNRGAVSSLSSEIGTLFGGIADKMRLAAILAHEPDRLAKPLLAELLEDDSHVVFAAASYGFKRFDQVHFIDKKFTETYGVDEKFFAEDLGDNGRPVPFG